MYSPHLAACRDPGSMYSPHLAPSRDPGIMYSPHLAPIRDPGIMYSPHLAPCRDTGSMYSPRVAPCRDPGSMYSPHHGYTSSPMGYGSSSRSVVYPPGGPVAYGSPTVSYVQGPVMSYTAPGYDHPVHAHALHVGYREVDEVWGCTYAHEWPPAYGSPTLSYVHGPVMSYTAPGYEVRRRTYRRPRSWHGPPSQTSERDTAMNRNYGYEAQVVQHERPKVQRSAPSPRSPSPTIVRVKKTPPIPRSPSPEATMVKMKKRFQNAAPPRPRLPSPEIVPEMVKVKKNAAPPPPRPPSPEIVKVKKSFQNAAPPPPRPPSPESVPEIVKVKKRFQNAAPPLPRPPWPE